ncbi:putative signal transducing protein [Pseudoalteromonas xiamenensis]
MTTQEVDDPFIWQCVYMAEHQLEAHIVRGLLTQAGIQTHLKGEFLQGALGEIPFEQTRVQVMVYAIKLARAQQILVNYQQQQKNHWQCPVCHEENGPAFDYCWSCETQRI